MKDPYDIVKTRYITEKSTMLESLSSVGAGNKRKSAMSKCSKYVFVVDPFANKAEIAKAIEIIYKEVKVCCVNTIKVKPKPKRKGRGRPGKTSGFKKAIVTLKEGCEIA